MDSDTQTIRQCWLETLPRDCDWESLDVEVSYRPPLDGETVAELCPEQPYTDLVEIGRGGMGIVYRARQVSLDRDVAIKALRAKKLEGRSASRARRNFLAEAYATGCLEHPNIVPLYDLAMSPEHELFLAMKLVGGKTWKQLMEVSDGPDLDGHLEILNQVCNAVAFAHSRGIVHNDLKPSNVMIGDFGEVLVVDWGLAVAIDGRADNRLRSRESIKSSCGTPAYMPPELAAGRGAEIGPWTDIYMLGGILYRLLSGASPHPGETFFDVVSHALKGQISALPAEAPAELRVLCERALAPKPGDRHASVQEFQAALRGYFRSKDSHRLASVGWEGLRRCQQDRTAGRAGAQRSQLYLDFSEVVSAFVQARSLWQDNQDAAAGERAARLAFAQTALQAGDLGLAEAQAQRVDPDRTQQSALWRGIAQERARKVRERRHRQRLQWGLGLALFVILAGLTAANLLLSDAKARIEHEKLQVERGKRLSDIRGDIAQEALQALSVEVQEQLLDSVGDAHAQDVAKSILQVSLAGWQKLRQAELDEQLVSRGSAVALLRIGELKLKVDGDVSAAEQAFRQACEIFAGLASQDYSARRDLAAGLENLGSVCRVQGKLGRAESLFVVSQQLRAQLLAEQGTSEARRDYAVSLKKLGQLYQQRGELDAAARLLAEQVDVRRPLADAAHEQKYFASALRQLGAVYAEAGDARRARPLFEEALAISLQLLAVDPHSDRLLREVAKNHSQLGDLAAADGLFEEAWTACEAARVIREELLAKSPQSSQARRWLCDSLQQLAALQQEMGAVQQAEPLIRRALEMRRALLELDRGNLDSRRELALCLLLASRVLRACGQEADARTSAQEGLRLWRALLIKDPSSEPAQRAIAELEQRLGASGQGENR